LSEALNLRQGHHRSAFFSDWAILFLPVDILHHSVKIPPEIRSPIHLLGRRFMLGKEKGTHYFLPVMLFLRFSCGNAGFSMQIFNLGLKTEAIYKGNFPLDFP